MRAPSGVRDEDPEGMGMSENLVADRPGSGLSAMEVSDRHMGQDHAGEPIGVFDLRLKRWVDIGLASVLLLLVLPLLAIVAAMVKLDSRGPILFRQERVGLHGRRFTMLKFRTLYHDRTDAAGRLQATWHDPRVTRVGRVLRRTSIDELPQLVNVIRGDMSLVGPRPHAPATEVDGLPFAEALPHYERRHCVKPGLTGWAQVNGWRGPTPTLRALENRLNCDLDYIENWSLTLDVIILLRTLGVPFAGHPDHEEIVRMTSTDDESSLAEQREHNSGSTPQASTGGQRQRDSLLTVVEVDDH
ncbi:MAG: exopolysaccharide biosynthesis polyprenyl glycosylphosphotransferase [Geminicoccaceae bacterium]|nr:exopolysaccharide biosynthesis polyprenyl glycosylphosphotransferase [Geminicoccaceae bacterium]